MSWLDPDIRVKRMEGLQKAHRSVAGRKHHSEATKKFLSDPINLKKRVIALKKAWAKPENKEKLKALSENGLKAAMAPAGRENFYMANKRDALRKKRSDSAKKNAHNRMKNRNKYSKLNDFFEQKMNAVNLYPEREFPIKFYSVDFCFPENKLVVEADGDFWHANPEFLKEHGIVELYSMQKRTVRLDKAKNTYLRNHGWTILRFWERDIKKDTNKCLSTINNTLIGIK